MNGIAFEESFFVFWGNQPTPMQGVLPTMSTPEIKVDGLVKEKTDNSDDALGRVVGFEDGLVKLLSPRNKASRSGYFFDENTGGKGFVELFLPVNEITPSRGYSIKTLSGILYRQCPPHTFYDIPRGLFTRDLCPKCWDEKCDEGSIGVGLINCWGSVMPVVMCAEHSKWNGALCESSTFNKQTDEWKEAFNAYFERKENVGA